MFEHAVPLGSRAYDGEWIVTSLLLDRAERFAGEVAMESAEGTATYAELVTRAERVAGFLTGLDVNPGDVVATMLPTSLDYIAAWHGILWRGAVDVPINNEFRGMFLEHILRDSGAATLVIHADWVDRLEGIDLPTLRHVVVVGEPTHAVPAPLVAHRFADALAADRAVLVPGSVTDMTYVIYTSGTTGVPKGAVHNNRSSFHYIMPFVEGLAITDEDVCYSMFPLFHQMGRSSCATTSLYLGNRLVLRNGFSASGFWEDVRDTGATWMGYLGAVIQFLWNQPEGPRDRDHGMRRAFGSSAPEAIFERWEERFGVTLYEVYGSTELGLGSGLGSGPRKIGTMGLPCRQLEVQIVDELDEPVAAGRIGEAVWRPRYPDATFQGYLNRPDATVETWRQLWFHSGDAGWLDEEGYFTFSDRIKDSIRRRGENISTFFVEESVRRAVEVTEIAAYAVVPPDASSEEEVMVALSTPEPLDVDALFAELIRTMPRHAVPRFIRIVDELPRTPTQKVRKFLLREEGVVEGTIDRVELGIEIPR